MWVVTRAPASRHTLAAARSSGPPRLRSTPHWAQAARWSPRESKVQTVEVAVYACKMGPKCLRYRMIVAANGWVVF